jgi:hypothetical protein
MASSPQPIALDRLNQLLVPWNSRPDHLSGDARQANSGRWDELQIAVAVGGGQ